MEHPYSQDETAGKVFYFLLQIAYLIFQLMEKGSSCRRSSGRYTKLRRGRCLASG